MNCWSLGLHVYMALSLIFFSFLSVAFHWHRSQSFHFTNPIYRAHTYTHQLAKGDRFWLFFFSSLFHNFAILGHCNRLIYVIPYPSLHILSSIFSLNDLHWTNSHRIFIVTTKACVLYTILFRFFFLVLLFYKYMNGRFSRLVSSSLKKISFFFSFAFMCFSFTLYVAWSHKIITRMNYLLQVVMSVK